jgi:phosphoglycolate phosphatase
LGNFHFWVKRLNVLFDLDGTLIDPREGILECLKYMLDSLGHPIPTDEILVRYIGPPLQENVLELLGSENRDRLAKGIALYRNRFSSQGVYEAHVYPGIHDVLSELRYRKWNLFVATTKPYVFATRILDHFHLSKFFSGVYGSELDGTRADKVELIAHLIKEESIQRANTYMIGDRAQDVLGALKNGVTPIGSLWGYGSRDELVNAGATLLCDKPSKLLEILSFAVGN